MLIFSDQPYNEAHADADLSVSNRSAYAGYQIIRRNGAVVAFEPHKIAVALMKAFLSLMTSADRISSKALECAQEEFLLSQKVGPRKQTAALCFGLNTVHKGFLSPERKALKAFFGARKVNGRNAP